MVRICLNKLKNIQEKTFLETVYIEIKNNTSPSAIIILELLKASHTEPVERHFFSYDSER